MHDSLSLSVAHVCVCPYCYFMLLLTCFSCNCNYHTFLLSFFSFILFYFFLNSFVHSHVTLMVSVKANFLLRTITYYLIMLLLTGLAQRRKLLFAKKNLNAGLFLVLFR